MSATVTTVRGPISPGDLGTTLTHEHCFIDVSVWFQEGSDAVDRPVDMALLADLRRRPFSTTRDNLVLDDEDVAVTELERFRSAGGASVVDVTPIGLGRDPEALCRVSEATGLHIVMGTSLYVENAHPAWASAATADQIAERFTADVRHGVGDTGIRAGLIGEIGVSGIPRGWGRRKMGPVTPEEEKVLRGAARASLRTGATVGVHIDPLEPRGTFAAIDVLTQEGVPPDRIVVNHMDQVAHLDYHLAVAATGAYVEYDSFGRDHYAEEWGADFSWGHDAWRTQFVRQLVDHGHGGQLLFSQDVCLKTDLRRYGGPGYGHVLQAIVPALRALGVSPEAIERILIENPARMLAIAA